MKKLLIVLAVLSILLSCSCNDMQTDSSTNTSGGSYSNNGEYYDAGGLALETYKEYLSYIENTDLPEDFVYYDDIKEFGDFKGLVSPQVINPNSDDNIGYMFNLMYKGKSICLTVVNILDVKLEELYEKDDIQVDLSDMRYPVSGKTGVVIHNDIRYIYLEGELYVIRWYEDGWSYTLNTLYRDVNDFPDNDGSALAKLIYLE